MVQTISKTIGHLKQKKILIRNIPVFLSILLVISLIFLTQISSLKEPFWGHHEFNGVFYGTFVKNFFRYGIFETKGAQITTPFLISSDNWSLHTHHPSTYPLLLYGWSKVFGISEASFRALSIFFTLIGFSVWQIYHKENFKKNLSALLSICIVITTPLIWYFSSLPVFEPLLFPLVILGVIGFQENKYLILYLSIFFAAIIDWPGYWLGIWIFLYYLWQKNYKKSLEVFSILALATLVIVAHQWYSTGHPFLEFLKIGSRRLAVSEQPFSTFEWLKLLISRTKAYLGIIVIIFCLLGLIVGWFTQYKKILVLSLIIGLSHILVFRNITWYHDYMIYHLLPFLLITLTIFIKGLLDRFGFKIIPIILCLWIFNLSCTWQFRTDLQALIPHKVCVDFGKKVFNSSNILTFQGSKEELNICPPFIGFYGEKEFFLELKN